MIPINDGAITRLVPESARVVDLIKQHGRSIVYRRIPAKRGGAKCNP